MRHSIATAPKDGKSILLEDVISGTYDVAHWASKAGEWVGENDEPSKITPTHWHPMQGLFAVVAPKTAAAVAAETARIQANRRLQVRLRFAISTVVAAALIGVYFQDEVDAFLRGYSGLQDNFRESASQELQKPNSFARTPAEVDQARAQGATQDAAEITQAVENSAPEARQSLKNELRSEASANELGGLMQ
jgi:hypothetical protein